MMQKVDMASAMHGMPSRVLVVVTLATVTANTAPVYRLVTKKFLTKKTPKFFGVFLYNYYFLQIRNVLLRVLTA